MKGLVPVYTPEEYHNEYMIGQEQTGTVFPQIIVRALICKTCLGKHSSEFYQVPCRIFKVAFPASLPLLNTGIQKALCFHIHARLFITGMGKPRIKHHMVLNMKRYVIESEL